MLSTSFEFRRQIAKNSKTVFKATITFADGHEEEFTGTDFMTGPSFTEATSSQSSFDVGAAVMGKHSFVLRNDDGRFDGYVFAGAVTRPWIGVELEDGTTEWLRKGVFGIEQPNTYGNTIALDSLDNMRLFERPYSDVATVYPATLGVIAYDICNACGMGLGTPSFANSDVSIAKRPDDSTMTCLDMISYIAQASGNWAKCDTLGRLCFGWYDTGAFEAEDWLDGQHFDGASPYASGDDADGGGFMTGGSAYDGGGFGSGRYIHLWAFADLSIMTDDVVITGVRVTASGEVTTDGTQGEAGETALYGSEGYVLEVAGNPLIAYGQAQAAAQRIGIRAVGMRFRPFTASAIGDPSYEAGDPVVITDRRQNQYRSYITSTTFRAGSYQAVSCNAETPSRNSAAGYSAITKAVVETRKRIKAEKTAREQAIERLQEEFDNSGGLYVTEQEQEDHSTVYYLHDKPTLAESQIVWKLAAEAFGVSVDGAGGPYLGFDAWGNAILSAIYAIGINANYVDTGVLRSRNGLLVLNLDTGVLTIGGNGVATADETISGVDVEYRLSDSSTELSGQGEGYTWSTIAPVWRDGAYMWQRTVTTYADTTIEYSQPTCISGSRGASGQAGLNQATVMLYQRSATAPAKPTAALTYTFATATLTGNTGDWGMGIPAGTAPCWAIAATATSNTATDTIAANEWSAPVKLAENGNDGSDGLNQATVFLFARARTWQPMGHHLVAPNDSLFSVSGNIATVQSAYENGWLVLDTGAPERPSVATTYDFTTGALSPVPSGWEREVPDGYDTCWVTTAVAISAGSTDTIAASEWAEVARLAQDGFDASIINVAYAVSTRGTEPPSTGWQSSVPVVARGMWLWVETTYNDNTVSYSCSYVGTDGEDGSSVAIQSVSKQNGVTTIVLTDADGSTKTLEIADGEDGSNGTPGSNGYVHIAWANSADGATDFSTTVSAGKSYVGMYTDNTAADSTNYRSYSWSLIKGADGARGPQGDTGRGVASIVEQYYLSTSNTSLVGGSWSEAQPTWTSGCYIWTRSKVTWDNSATPTYTTAVLAKALNKANEEAAKANALVRNYNDGVLVCREGNTVGALVNADGSFDIANVTWAGNVPSAGTRLATFGTTAYIGNGTHGLAINDRLISLELEGESAFEVGYTPATTQGGYNWYMLMDFMAGMFRCKTSGYNQPRQLSTEGYPLLFLDGSAPKYWNGTSYAAQALSKLTIGSRASGTEAYYSLSFGTGNVVSGNESAAFGAGLIAQDTVQTVIGIANVAKNGPLLIVGNGMTEGPYRSNVFEVNYEGGAWLSGTLTQSSDKRLKKHIAYLGDDAVEFVRKLKPVLFSRKKVKQLGFYAQDVQEADTWGSSLVSSTVSDDRLGFETLTLEYTSLIAPIVAYAQSLEERVAELESALKGVLERLDNAGL